MGAGRGFLIVLLGSRVYLMRVDKSVDNDVLMFPEGEPFILKTRPGRNLKIGSNLYLFRCRREFFLSLL